uniref:Uncharacterized protein n=1 Tax=Tolypothrix bouteillei VB521301 TaxID=1479485 RepID=A0A0C1QLL5_9CYAN
MTIGLARTKLNVIELSNTQRHIICTPLYASKTQLKYVIFPKTDWANITRTSWFIKDKITATGAWVTYRISHTC